VAQDKQRSKVLANFLNSINIHKQKPHKWLAVAICLMAFGLAYGQSTDNLSLIPDPLFLEEKSESNDAYIDTTSQGNNKYLNSDIMSVTSGENGSLQQTRPARQRTSPLIESEVKYRAADSTQFFEGKVFLYREAVVSYQDVELTAHYIELDLENNMAYATGTRDSLGMEIGLPVFKDKGGEYTMRSIRYNFKTERAIIEHVVTTQGEGFVVSERAKKNADNTYFLKDGRYTTCDNHDHPHFYINMTKAKVIPGEKIITGPAYLVVEDVRIFPLIIPFAFVPSTQSYSSGFLMPSYGEESNRGFFLREGGYYLAASDYFDLALTGDLYANGSWGMRTSSNYRKRYKFSGSFNAQRITNIFSEKDLPDYSKSNDFSVTWSHRQDPKANPLQSLSASVNFSTSSFDRNNVGSIINPEILATNTKRSSINYARQFPGTPFNFSMSALGSQSSRDSTVSVTIPDLTLTMRSIYPFKNNNRIGGVEAWYERINFQYTGTMRNEITTKESDFSMSSSSLANDWRNGVRHNVPLSLNLKLFRFFSLTPSVNYTERWYFKSIEKNWDEDRRQIVTTDTISGFNRVWDYNFGVSTNTKVYTFFTPSRALFGDKVDAIRHVMTPNVSLNYRPDFGESKYGYYDWFEYYDPNRDEVVRHDYSIYEGGIYGVPGRGKSGSMGFGLNNTLEMKVKSDRDSTGFRKISILESLNFSSSYNFLADSLNLSNISMSGRTKILGTSINFGATFDPYALDTIPTTSSMPRVIKVNRFEWNENRRPARLQNANLSFGFNFGSETFKKRREGRSPGDLPEDSVTPLENEPEDIPPGMNQHEQGQTAAIQNVDPLEAGDDGYVKFEIPWNISVNYNMRLIQDNFNKERMAYDHKLTADISLSGRISLTKKWDLSVSSGYNLDRKQISHTNVRINRNLHCWNMSFNMVPVGQFKSFFFNIAVNSSLLRDLKYEKRSHPRDNPTWF
jgi:lipopolysaccharide assembly outer membrane protein LptD (OstA)